MASNVDLRGQAKTLRLAGQYDEALPIYLALWDETKAEIDAAGVLHCLRKKKEYAEAISFIEQLPPGPYQKDWIKNEIAWAYIEGCLLKQINDLAALKVIEIANKIVALKPDPKAVKTAVFVVLKVAKQNNRWEIIDEWVEKVDPGSLSNEPNAANGIGWSDQSSWYNYRIRSYIELNYNEKALELLKQVEDSFPRERKFFQRLKGLASYKLRLLPQALEIYKPLCKVPKPDWWLLHEYANVIYGMALQNNDGTMKEQALNLMYNAAISCANTNKAESLLRILQDIVNINQGLNHEEAIIPHLLLLKRIREDNNWPIPSLIAKYISNLESSTKEYFLKSKRELLGECQKIWHSATAENATQSAIIRVAGKLILGQADRPFCFIVANEKNCFCPKSKLLPGMKDGDIVKADIVSAFDTKKNKNGWKVVKVLR
jgi:hypothetical protein